LTISVLIMNLDQICNGIKADHSQLLIPGKADGMKKKLFLLLIVFFPLYENIAADDNNYRQVPQKITKTDDIWIDVNHMNGILRNNGTWFYNNLFHDWGLEWPKGSGLSPVFAAGQVIAAKINGEIRVAGVQHSATEYQPGEIIKPDSAADKNDSKYRWYELRSVGAGDWSNWPIEQGAPTTKEGMPRSIGDQTVFCVFNDLTGHTEYGSAPLNAEVKQTVWAYDRIDALGDMIFIKWQIVNKGDCR